MVHVVLKIMKFTPPLLAVAIALMMFGGTAHAQIIGVPNASFENPSTEPPVAGNGDYFQVNNNDSSFVPNWTFNDSSSVSGTLANRFAGIGNPGTSDGSRVAFFNIGPGQTGTATTSAPLTTITSGLGYIMTVAVGNTPGTGNFADPGTAVLNLYAQPAVGPMVLAATLSINADAIPDGTIQDFSLRLNSAQAALFAGDGLYLQFEGINAETNGESTQLLFDNVRLQAVPEPSTWAMMLGGLTFLALCIRRKLA